jgi:hypothetical protein
MSKPFSFLLCALCLLTAACSFNPDMQGKGESYLQGEWQQELTPVQKQLLSYSLYTFKFTCDSFFVTQQTFSKVNTGVDTCTNKGQWTEYMRGTYRQQNDTLRLKGFFCDAKFGLKKYEGCFRSGPYEEVFKVNKKADTLLTFTGPSSVIPIIIYRTQKSTCVPKPL